VCEGLGLDQKVFVLEYFWSLGLVKKSPIYISVSNTEPSFSKKTNQPPLNQGRTPKQDCYYKNTIYVKYVCKLYTSPECFQTC